MSQQAEKWDQRFSERHCADAQAAAVLSENSHLLPRLGNALDLASGLGGNAILLAQAGLEVTAIDLSRVAMSKLDSYAQEQQLAIHCHCYDLEVASQQSEEFKHSAVSGLEENSFDVIVVSHYLYRPLLPALLSALKPGGLLYYQTFTQQHVAATGPSNTAYRLAKNELLEFCEALHILFYREEGLQGDTEQGFRNQAMIIAQRPE